MKNYLIVTLLLIGFQASFAQKGRDARKLWRSFNNFEVQAEGVGVEGTKLIKVWAYAKKEQDAIVKAKKQAVAACIFKGVTGGGIVIKPIVDKTDIADKYEDYFDDFFKTGGKYLQFITVTTDATGKDKAKVGRGYKIGLTVSVMYDALRKELENEGIVEKLGQAIGYSKKPKIMIIPSMIYCKRKGFVKNWLNEETGEVEVVRDFDKLLQNDEDMRNVIVKMQGIMADRGFPISNLEQSMRNLKAETADLSVRRSKSGLSIAESPTDILKRVAKADIIIDIDFNIHKQGPKKAISFTLQGLDAYTSKAVANANGEGKPSFTSSPGILLEEAVLRHMDNFNAQLQTYFQDLAKNGREVVVKVKLWKGVGFDLEKEFDGDELRDIIDDWFADNTVNGVYNLTDDSENYMNFEQVRIPLYYIRKGNQKAMDIKRFLRPLIKQLKNPPYNITVKIEKKGLGEAWLILGGK